MEQTHHPRPGGTARHRLTMVAVAALTMTLVATGCSADQPAAEPSVRDTATGESTDSTDSDGSILQATVVGDARGDDAGDTDGDADGATPDTGVTSPDSGSACDGGGANEIRFEPGANSVTITAAVSSGQQDHYELEVGADQIMTIRVASGDDSARAEVRAPTTPMWSNDFSERVIAPTQAGLYEICVIAGQAGADYELFVSVIDDTTPDRVDASWCGSTVNDRGSIRFDIGAFGSTIDGAVLRDERDLYTIEAATGQDIDVLLVSLEDNAVFDLRSPSGVLLATEISDLRTPLSEDGVYQICIGSVRGNASYTLSADIV